MISPPLPDLPAGSSQPRTQSRQRSLRVSSNRHASMGISPRVIRMCLPFPAQGQACSLPPPCSAQVPSHHHPDSSKCNHCVAKVDVTTTQVVTLGHMPPSAEACSDDPAQDAMHCGCRTTEDKPATGSPGTLMGGEWAGAASRHLLDLSLPSRYSSSTRGSTERRLPVTLGNQWISPMLSNRTIEPSVALLFATLMTRALTVADNPDLEHMSCLRSA